MRTSHVRAFALIGALCCALTRLAAQTNTQVVVPLPSPVTTQPGSTAQTPPPTNQANDAPSTTTVVTNSPTQIQRPSPMIRQGDAQLEWRTSYSHSSKNAIFVDGVAILPVIVVGQIGVERVRRDTVTTSISGRYGLLNNLQAELRAPFRFEYDRYAVPEVNPPARAGQGTTECPNQCERADMGRAHNISSLL